VAIDMQPKVFLAGRVAVETNGVVIDEARFPGRQGRLLFAYLVAEQGRPVPRDELAEALWGESPPASWDKALTGIVSRVRGLLADQGIDGAKALTGAFGCYRLDLPEGTWVDVVVAEKAAQEAESALAGGDLETARDAAALAASLLRQPFLPGEEGTWVEEKRRELVAVRERALNVLAEACLRSGDPREAARWAEQTIALAPFRESGYRRLMEAHAAAGNRAEALRVYEQCRRLLADELGAYPSPETEAVYRELLAIPTEPTMTNVVPERRSVEAAPRALRRPRRRALVFALAALAALAAVGTAAMATRGGGPTIRPESVVKIDAATGKIAGVIPVGRDPGEVEAVGPWVFVTSLVERSLYRISRRDGGVTRSGLYATGRSLARQDDAHLWVPSPTQATVRLASAGSLLYSPGDDIPLPLPEVPGFGATFPAVTIGGGSVWIAEKGNHEVSRWRHRVLATARRVRTYPLQYEDYTLGAAFGDGAAWFGLGHPNDSVLRIDAATGRAVRIPVGTWPTKPAFGFGSIWVPMFLDDTVWRLDPETGKPQAIVKVGHRPWSVAVGRGAVWVTDHCDGTLDRIDPATNAVDQRIHTGYHPQWLAAAGDFVWVGIAGKEYRGPMSCGRLSTAY